MSLFQPDPYKNVRNPTQIVIYFCLLYTSAYSFVKEYGEGVDRMCKELEAVGLQDPEYRLNAFMLQTTIRNSTLTDKKPRFGW